MQTQPDSPGILDVVGGFASSLLKGFTSEQERLLDAVLNASSDHLFVIDRDGRILYAGLNGAQTLGIDRRDILGKRARELNLDLAFLTRLGEDRIRVFTTGEAVGGAITYPTVYGPRDYEYTLRPLTGSDGQVEAAVFSARDVTERNHALAVVRVRERQLTDSEELYRTLAESVPQMVWTLRADGSAEYCNRQMLEYMGFQSAAEAPAAWDRALHPDEKAEVYELWETSLRTGAPFERECRLRRASDGAYRWHLVRGQPVRDSAGHVVRWFGTDTDIDDQKRAEVVLAEKVMELTRLALENAQLEAERHVSIQRTEESLALLDALLDAAPVGFAFLDTEFRYRQINNALARINGVPKAQMIGRTVEEVVPDIWSQVQERYRQALEAGEPVLNNEVHGVTAADPGTQRSWLSNYYPVQTAAGQMLGLGIVVSDITERRQAEEYRERHMREVEVLNARLQRAMSETHHRVKNNLQVITALLNMETLVHEETVPASNIEEISQHVQALAMIHDLLTRQAKQDALLEDMPVRTTLETLLPMIQRLIGGRTLRYTIADARISIRQSSSLAMLVNELVSNAVKHGQGEICLTFTVCGGTGCLEVIDEGPGFPDVFEPQASASTGLELIQSLVTWDLGGTIRYENADGGARVAVEFPVKA